MKLFRFALAGLAASLLAACGDSTAPSTPGRAKLAAQAVAHDGVARECPIGSVLSFQEDGRSAAVTVVAAVEGERLHLVTLMTGNGLLVANASVSVSSILFPGETGRYGAYSVRYERLTPEGVPVLAITAAGKPPEAK